VGHAYTADAVLACQSEEVERTLWTLLRAHQERAALARRMAEQERGQNRGLAADLEGRARDYEAAADLVRNLLREGNEALTGSEASTRVRIDHGKEIE
jgi:two-component system chemotaxis response regulator CheB